MGKKEKEEQGHEPPPPTKKKCLTSFIYSKRYNYLIYNIHKVSFKS